MSSTPPTRSRRSARTDARGERSCTASMLRGEVDGGFGDVPEGTPVRRSETERTVAARRATRSPAPTSRRASSSARRGMSARWWIVSTAAVSTALIVAIGFVIHLWRVADAWDAQVTAVTSQNYDLGAQVAAAQEELAALTRTYNTTSEQLSVVQQRVLDLSAEAAQRDDNAEFYSRQINDLRDTLAAASSVTTALNQCIEYKTQLLDHLSHAEDYDPSELTTFENDVNRQCRSAVNASVQLQSDITQ